MEISGIDLKEKIKNGEKLIVEFWAEWCGPCRVMKPIFERVANSNENDDVKMYTMDIDLNKEVAIGFGVRSIPTIKVFNGGSVIGTKVGVLNETSIKDLVKELINE
jgi:thioredoxin 1